MKKGVWLSILAVLLSGVIVYSIWYIYRRGELQNNSKDSFIPYNSALVVQINAGVSLPEKVGLAFQSNISDFQKILLYQVASLLEKKGFIAPTSRVHALRLIDVPLAHACGPYRPALVDEVSRLIVPPCIQRQLRGHARQDAALLLL